MAGRSPTFRTVLLTLSANGEAGYSASGNVISVLSANGSFEMSFGDDSFFETEAGLGYAPDDGSGLVQTFRTLRFRDTSGATNTVRVQIGTGKIFDNRAVFGNSELPVKTNPSTELQVKTKAGTALTVTPDAAAVFDVQAAGGGALPIDNDAATALYGQRLSDDGGSIVPFGASGGVFLAAGTVVSAVANVSGLTLRTCAMWTASGGAGALEVGGQPVVTAYNSAATLPREIYVPAGIAVTLTLTAGSMRCGVSYDLH